MTPISRFPQGVDLIDGLNQLVDRLNSVTPRSSATVRVSTTPGGSTFDTIKQTVVSSVSGDVKDAVVVKVIAAESGGGIYSGRILTGDSTADGGDELTMPEGMTVPDADNALVLNLDENGESRHGLVLNSYAVGLVVGSTTEGTPRTIVAIPRGQARTATPDTVGAASEGNEAADTATWAREADDAPVDVYVCSRVGYFDAGNETLYAYIRKLSFDASGRLVAVSAETRVSVDVPEAC
jgi:hypothetical protein